MFRKRNCPAADRAGKEGDDEKEKYDPHISGEPAYLLFDLSVWRNARKPVRAADANFANSRSSVGRGRDVWGGVGWAGVGGRGTGETGV